MAIQQNQTERAKSIFKGTYIGFSITDAFDGDPPSLKIEITNLLRNRSIDINDGFYFKILKSFLSFLSLGCLLHLVQP